MRQPTAASLLRSYMRTDRNRQEAPPKTTDDWWDWIVDMRRKLAALPENDCPSDAKDFYAHYRQHIPCLLPLPNWPAFGWTLDSLSDRVGDQQVQVQVDRLSDPDYEVRSNEHRGWMTFREFANQVQHGRANNVYLTAQNRSHNLDLINELANDLKPMPSFLTPHPALGYLWLGKGTLTPLHHDVTTNIMCQVMGKKHIRLIAPEYYKEVEHRSGVHTNITWPSEEWAAKKSIPLWDFWLEPGYCLHLPCGWWHAVKTQDLSLTVVYTNIRWDTAPHIGFPR